LLFASILINKQHNSWINVIARVLSTFLNEMDGVDGSIGDGVLVLGATNRPSTLDSALIRPGRFDKVIYVPNPDKEGRQMILKAQCQKWEKNGSDIKIDTDKLSGEIFTGMMTGAEIVGACREAAMLAIREMLLEGDGKDKCAPTVQQHHLVQTLGAVNPLLSDPRVLSEYTSFEEKYAQ
jgi:SpoVK/Ycf46/Vps4 family AAA+-type ATPase